MNQIKLYYNFPILNNFDIIINDMPIDKMNKRLSCAITIPYPQVILKVKQGYIQSSTIQVQDGDTVFITINPLIYIAWAFFILCITHHIYNLLIFIICCYITINHGYRLKVAPSSTQLQLRSQLQ